MEHWVANHIGCNAASAQSKDEAVSEIKQAYTGMWVVLSILDWRSNKRSCTGWCQMQWGNMLGMDFKGPFPKSKKGRAFLFITVDYYTKRTELFPLKDSKTNRVCQNLKDEVFSRWGVPKYILSDRGPQFLSQLLTDLCTTQVTIHNLISQGA